LAKKLTIQEQVILNQWDELYQYVKQNILGYPKEINLSKHAVLRLKGLSEGKFMSNKKQQQSEVNYGYKTILLTFKFKKQEIINAMSKVEFKDETHKINYIMTIVENSINDIYLRLINNIKHEEKVAEMKIESLESDGAGYQRKSDDVEIDDDLIDLW